MRYGFRHVLLEDNYKVGEGATRPDAAGWTPKQMMSRVDADSEFLFQNLISYAEFPPLVPPSMAKKWAEPRKKAGGFMHPTDRNDDIVAPLLRPDLPDNKNDQELYHKICSKLGIDPEVKDNDSYMQLMNYNQIVYFEVQRMAPRLVTAW
jgi:hypothetical protein